MLAYVVCVLQLRVDVGYHVTTCSALRVARWLRPFLDMALGMRAGACAGDRERARAKACACMHVARSWILCARVRPCMRAHAHARGDDVPPLRLGATDQAVPWWSAPQISSERT